MALWLALVSSLPRTTGRVTLAVEGHLPQATGQPSLPRGLSGPVSISRDRFGIPTIRATTAADAAFALGYVHAQDRLWQMETMRRLGRGRLAELLGPAALPIDRFARTLGLAHLTETTWPALEPETQRLLGAYANGVNQFLAAPGRLLPPEFLLTAHRPEPWIPTDSLLWGRLMGLWLAGDWAEELTRAALAGRLTDGQMRSLWPALSGADLAAFRSALGPQETARATPDPSPTTSTAASPTTPAAADLARLAAAVPDLFRPQGASNAWALAGGRTASGLPLLAGDPHLGFQAPIQWYLARIETPGQTLIGATAPGVPFLVLGTNGALAWSLTTTHADTADLVMEAVTGPEGDHYQTEAGPRPFATRTETLRVRFGDPVPHMVRASRTGPILSDGLLGRPALATAPLLASGRRVLALASPALRPVDHTADALVALNRARSVAEGLAALDRFEAPQQTVILADGAGAIARATAGLLPIRRSGFGRLPMPGEDNRFAWTGYLPSSALPRAVNPAEGVVYNTNSALDPEGTFAGFLVDSWPGEDRAARLHRLLTYKTRQTVRDMALFQTDTVSPAMARLVPLLTRDRGLDDRVGPDGAWALAHLRAPGWRADMAAPRLEPLLAAAWLRRLVPSLFADEMGTLYPLWERLDVDLLTRILTDAARGGDGLGWCDDHSTRREVESCGDILAHSLTWAMTDLAVLAPGGDHSALAWGDRHRATFGHDLLSRLPGLAAVASLSTPTGGGDHTLSRGSWRLDSQAADSTRAFRHIHGAGLRLVIDLADPDRSGFSLATGQSGHLLSPHYRDLLPLWRDGRLLTLDGRDTAGGVLHLAPGGD